MEASIAAAAAGQLSRLTLDVLDQTFQFDSVLLQLQITSKFVVARIQTISQLRDSSDAIRRLTELLQKAEEIVRKCVDVACWNFLKKYRYSKKLIELDESIRRFFSVELQVVLLEETTRISNQIEQLIKRMDQRAENSARININQFEQLIKTVSNGSRIKLHQAASGLKRKVLLSLCNWFLLYLIPFLRIHKWSSYQRITNNFC